MKHSLTLLALFAAAPALAEETREMDAHEHGVGELNIAVEASTVVMEFHAPGADIVGFEYEAKSDADLAAIDAAIAKLNAPLDLFVLPAAAGCTVVSAHAELESEDEHDAHHEEEEEHSAHDDHKEHEEHAHDEHDHDEHAHDEHGHDEAEAGHTEFHAEYELTCNNPDALMAITFAYFETFPNALEVEVQIVTAKGAQAFEVERTAPVLTLEGMI
ncbi:DUF2796 domain-containing protein [uncultured Roseobacter sp.]|uniref:zinc uptake protein ZrgA n=1 Tax=uncultured Roseobacter sp. TaxID=114847 RepID=UPI00262F9080|nr:DUF2796 domain-containing protein [uncultured Roseobacter sp.]